MQTIILGSVLLLCSKSIFNGVADYLSFASNFVLKLNFNYYN